MKKNRITYLLCSLLLVISSCNDFFRVDTDNVLDHLDYIDEESEMYSGYIGIMTKMQAIGDKIIYLTDTRGEMLEPTVNTPGELYSIYNYEENLTENSYADPAPYYDVVIACNDYLLKLYDYKNSHSASINTTHYEALVSSTLRVKAWIYLTLAKVYGEALWFDDPIRELKELSQFKLMNLDEVVSACRTLLDEGFDEINGQHTFSWKEWVDPYTDTGSSDYRYWDYMTPEYFPLYAELCLWAGDYQKTVNLILNAMNSKFASTVNDATAWMHNMKLSGVYRTVWDNANPLAQETVSAIIYNYSKNQRNSLLKHFETEYPNEYLLAPAEVAMNRYSDADFNPLGSAGSDKREGITFTKNSDGNYVITKFRSLSSTVRQSYQDDVHIYIYRGSDLYFMLAEALNNLGRFPEASALINQGISGTFPNGGVIWSGFTDDWTSNSSIGTRKYPDVGIRGAFSLSNRAFSSDIKENDLAILDEMMLEFACEGRTYPAMVRIAKRHGDYNIIADRVCPKYSNADEIRAKILAGGYFLNWELKVK